MDTALYKQLETDAKEWVEEAGKILVAQEHSFTISKQKDDVDAATSADIEVEKYLTEKILEKYPDHAIYGEELHTQYPDAQYVWIIDPLDGTKEYIRGMGEYNILVAVEKNELIVTGVVRRFGHNIVYSTSKGNGSFMNNRKIHVSNGSSFKNAIISANLPSKKNTSAEKIDSYVKLYSSIIKRTYRLRPGSDDAKMIAWVAQGAYDAYISFPNRQKWWDVAPALLLVKEADGKITDWEGSALKNHDLSKGIVVSNGLLHDQLLDIVKEAL